MADEKRLSDLTGDELMKLREKIVKTLNGVPKDDFAAYVNSLSTHDEKVAGKFTGQIAHEHAPTVTTPSPQETSQKKILEDSLI